MRYLSIVDYLDIFRYFRYTNTHTHTHTYKQINTNTHKNTIHTLTHTHTKRKRFLVLGCKKTTCYFDQGSLEVSLEMIPKAVLKG